MRHNVVISSQIAIFPYTKKIINVIVQVIYRLGTCIGKCLLYCVVYI